MEILWLGEPDCHNRTLVGGKVANLSRLAASYRVPPGFCLTTVALQKAITAGFVLEENAPQPQTLPDIIDGELARAYQTLADRCSVVLPSVAVRSSAVDEDGTSASFAGQYETYLNIIGVNAIAEAVMRCWGTVQSARVLDYRRQQGLARDGTQLAVLVQQLVMADVSAVVFSANPVSGNPDEVVINASWGLGESIVGGTVTPDTYVIHKADLSVASRQIAEKGRMTVAVDGGTQEVGVPRFLRTQPSISDDHAAEMAQLALKLETEMGWPVDIECAYHAGDLYLLQCRPITTLQQS